MRGDSVNETTKIEIDSQKNFVDEEEGFCRNEEGLAVVPSSSAYGTLGTHAELVWYSFFGGVHAF